MKKDGLIMYERNYARHLLLILEKLNKIDRELSVRIKNKQVSIQDNKSI